MVGAMMRSAWARLQDFICKATDTQYPATRYSFNWDPDSGNASLKILGNTFRHTAVSEAAGKEGCAREAFARGILMIILTEAKPHKGKESELKRLAAAYGNINRLPSMEELYPGSVPLPISPLPDHHRTSGPRFYNGPLPNIPSLALPAPETAKERLQVFIADIFGESSPLFDQIDFVQARAGNSPWSIILCNREYTSQAIYLDKEAGQEAAVRVALEKGALSVLLKEHEPLPQYHAAAVDLIAKFSSPVGLSVLPPPMAHQSGSRTPIPGQAGSATPLYIAGGGSTGASPYLNQHGGNSLPPMSPYHMPLVPVSPYFAGCGSDAGFISGPGQRSPHHEKGGRSSSRRRHSSRSRSQHRSTSKRGSRGYSRRRRESSPFTDASSDQTSRSTKRRKGHRSHSKRHSRSKSRRKSRRRDSSYSQNTTPEEDEVARVASDVAESANPSHGPSVGAVAEHSSDDIGQGAAQDLDRTFATPLDINRELSQYLDYLLDSLDPREQEVYIKEESPDVSLMSSHAAISLPKLSSLKPKTTQVRSGQNEHTLIQRLDSSNREKIKLIEQACVLSATMQNVRSAIDVGQESMPAAEQEMVLLPRAWIEETLDILYSHSSLTSTSPLLHNP